LFGCDRLSTPPAHGATARGREHLDPCTVEISSLSEMPAEGARVRLSVGQPEDVARHLIEARAPGNLVSDIRHEPVEHIEPRGRRLACPEQGAIHVGHEIRIGIGGATEHHPVNVLQLVRVLAPASRSRH
jgi:hypothetical protein